MSPVTVPASLRHHHHRLIREQGQGMDQVKRHRLMGQIQRMVRRLHHRHRHCLVRFLRHLLAEALLQVGLEHIRKETSQ